VASLDYTSLTHSLLFVNTHPLVVVLGMAALHYLGKLLPISGTTSQTGQNQKKRNKKQKSRKTEEEKNLKTVEMNGTHTASHLLELGSGQYGRRGKENEPLTPYKHVYSIEESQEDPSSPPLSSFRSAMNSAVSGVDDNVSHIQIDLQSDDDVVDIDGDSLGLEPGKEGGDDKQLHAWFGNVRAPSTKEVCGALLGVTGAGLTLLGMYLSLNLTIDLYRMNLACIMCLFTNPNSNSDSPNT